MMKSAEGLERRTLHTQGTCYLIIIYLLQKKWIMKIKNEKEKGEVERDGAKEDGTERTR